MTYLNKMNSLMTLNLLRFCLFSSFASVSHLALAEDPALDTSNIKATTPQWSGDAELGFIRTNGNSDTESFNGKFHIIRDNQPLKTAFKFEALTSEEDGASSKEKYRSEFKIDYSLTDQSYLASLLTYEDDRFSGYDYRGTLSIGYGYHAWNTENGHLDLEVGPGYRRSSLEIRNDEGDRLEEEVIGRFSLNLAVNLSENAVFTEVITIEGGNSGVVYKSDMGLQSTLVGTLAMKINYQIKHTDEVPEDTKNTDSVVGVTLVYGF
jgi:putative salt-induced outer membrane protein YdiY